MSVRPAFRRDINLVGRIRNQRWHLRASTGWLEYLSCIFIFLMSFSTSRTSSNKVVILSFFVLNCVHSCTFLNQARIIANLVFVRSFDHFSDCLYGWEDRGWRGVKLAEQIWSGMRGKLDDRRDFADRVLCPMDGYFGPGTPEPEKINRLVPHPWPLSVENWELHSFFEKVY